MRKHAMLFIAVSVLGVVPSGCGSDRRAAGSTPTAEDAAVSAARGLAASNPESVEGANVDGVPASQPENSEPAAI